MANTNRAVSIVVALLVAGLLLAVLFPIAIGAMSGPDETSVTQDVGDSETVTVDDTEVTISPSEATASSATTTYEYPTTYGWGSGASSLWGIIPVLIVLGGLLMLVKLALDSK